MIINLNGLRFKGITNKLSKEIAKILLLRILPLKIPLAKENLSHIKNSSILYFIENYSI
jgi:hypothetical protein